MTDLALFTLLPSLPATVRHAASGEGRSPREHHVGQDTKTPEVTLLIVREYLTSERV